MNARRIHLAQRKCKDQQGHEQVENALQNPGGELRGDGYSLFQCNQIRPNELSRPAKKRNRGEPDDGGGEEPSDRRMGLHGPQENSPAKRAHQICAEDGNGGEEQPPAVQSGDAASGERPVESPLGKLSMQKPCQCGNHEHTASNPFPGLTLNRRSSAGSRKSTGTPEKLN